MKKIFYLLVISAGLLFMASCTKRYDVVPNQTVYADLKTSDWTASDTDYTALINTPQIDNYFNQHGGINVYFTFDGGQSFEQIPEVYNGISFSYTYTAGGIELYAQNADGTKPTTAPGNLTAKIVLVESN